MNENNNYGYGHEDWNTPDTCYCPRNEEGSCMVCEKEEVAAE